jgi:hypothetical protein
LKVGLSSGKLPKLTLHSFRVNSKESLTEALGINYLGSLIYENPKQRLKIEL